MLKIENNVLIYDIETKTFGKPNPEKDELRLFGCYSYKTNKLYVLTKKEDIQNIINAHKFLVGFNNIYYDNPIIVRSGIKIDYKIIIDLKAIFKERAGVMKIKEGILNDLLIEYSLDFITRTLGIVDNNTAKEKIDYSVFKKDVWTKEELEIILKYTKRDIEVTKKLYEWVEEYFVSFKDFLKEEDINKKQYLTVSTAKFVYKAICKAMNWEEKYGIYGGDESSGIQGGYVAYPAGERFEGDIYCLDFNSLYPHAMIQCNLYGRKKENNDRPVLDGNNIWKVEGQYYSDKLSPIAELLKNWYQDRLKYKKVGDRKEYTIKIIVNTIYGILNNSYYVNVYDTTAGGDCTRLGRQWIKYSRKVFRSKGYKVLYTDTDSVYILDTFNDKEKLLNVKKEIVEFIKTTVPFPQSTFDMGIDDEIKYMFFFKGTGVHEHKETDIEMDEDDFINKNLNLLKKNYIYVTKENKVKIKNLGLRKKSNSMLSRKIFWEYLVPKIVETGNVKFKKTYIRQLIIELLEKDIKLAVMRKEVDEVNNYKVNTSLQAQISKKYGSGIHFLIPNIKGVGVGKGKSFCTIDEFKEHKLNISHIDLDNVWSELNYFIEPVITKNIFDFVK